MTRLPFGSWPSPLGADLLVEQVVALGDVHVSASPGLHGPNAVAVWWNERRPQEAGRQVVVRDGTDVLPAGFSARTRVHEYGGGAYAVHGDTLFFSSATDGRLWRLDPGSEPRPITPDDGSRYADGTIHPDGRRSVWVRERHTPDGVLNDLVALAAEGAPEPVVVASGHDFFAAPRFSPDGRRLAWLSWDHPNMPWDGTELWVDGERVAGGPEESVTQPRWSPAGVLHYISDRSGWWNLYDERGTALAPLDAEFAGPDWVFGLSSYAFLPDGRLVATWTSEGLTRLGVVAGGRAQPLDLPFTEVSYVQALGRDEVVAVAASPTRAPAVVAIDVGSGAFRVLRQSRPGAVPEHAISEPRAITFPTAAGLRGHAFFYPPRLEGVEGPAGERPPLIVRSHGGPTSAARSSLNLEIQYWTSRGFAVVDVDYGGSTGYGREYRRRLDGLWGIVDVDDCGNAALHLAATGEVDRARLVIRGGSAGGYTTLATLTFRDVFATGASYYGVADLETLARDTHKFESRYLDRLVGPYPAARPVYRERSPIHFASRISVPVILFQGLEDKVVPPSQAEVLVSALRENGIPFSYVAFEGEDHGFRRADTIVRTIEAELWFYGQVLGFEPADQIEPVEIEHRDSLQQQKPR